MDEAAPGRGRTGGAWVSVRLRLPVREVLREMPLLAEHENITLGKTSAVTVTRNPFQLPLRVTLEANGEIVFTLKEKAGAFSFVGDWVWHKQTLQPLGLPPGAQSVLQAPVRVPRSQVPMFLSQHWPQLQAAGGVEANFKLEDFTLEPQAPRFALSCSPELLEGIFFPNSPLHDGAVVVRGNRVVAASVTLPLSDNTLPGELGTRHRAGLGITERTDAVSLVVSEETGQVSVAADGRMYMRLDDARMRGLLDRLLGARNGKSQ